MQELKLAVNLGGWRIFTRRKDDPKFQPVAKRIHQRDAYTCQYCGFQAMEYQEVVNRDGNYTNNKFSNLMTACCFCVQPLFLQSVGFDELSGGQLIYLPEMTQGYLNSLCHVLFCAMGNNTVYQDSSQSIYRSLKYRSQIIENRFGVGASQPAVFGKMLLELNASEPKKHKDLLKDVRFLPSHAKFKVQLDAWAEAALKELEEAENQEE